MQRKLTAILDADVVGWSRLSQTDETGTLARLKRHRAQILDPLMAEHGGRVVKLVGDGTLAEFPSVVAAVACALAIQEAMSEAEPELDDDQRIRMRIGVNLGDVIIDGDDIYGEGVNVAARLQTVAPPGGVSISRTVRDHIEHKLPCTFEDMGEHVVKSHERPVHVFSVHAANRNEQAGRKVEKPRKLSICVLPFANMSGDVEQEYFSDGISEDIITDLSKVSALAVISRNSAFQYKGKHVDLPKVARELKVSHVLEGSVRKAGGRVRITAQLIDGATNDHVWAERYDRDLNDIFALQDEISEAIVKALKLKLLPEEKKAIERRGTDSVDAYNFYLMARQIYLSGLPSLRNSEAIIRLCTAATAIDADYAQAWALMGIMQQVGARFWGEEMDAGLTAAERALALNASLADAHVAMGRVYFDRNDYDAASKELDIALRLDPDLYEALILSAILSRYQQKHRDCIRHLERAESLNDMSPLPTSLIVNTYVSLGDMESARPAAQRVVARAQKALVHERDNGRVMAYLAQAYAVLGEPERTREMIKRGMVLDPNDPFMKAVFATALVQLNDKEAALDILHDVTKTVSKRRFEQMFQLAVEPLRDHPRFKAMFAAAEARWAAEGR